MNRIAGATIVIIVALLGLSFVGISYGGDGDNVGYGGESEVFPASSAVNFSTGGLSYSLIEVDKVSVSVDSSNPPTGSISIPATVRNDGNTYDVILITENAFEYCTGLTSVTIPSSVMFIGYYAFRGCTGLTSVTIPSSVIFIGEEAFEYCTRLTSVTIPGGVQTIRSNSFNGCTGLTYVNILDGVREISNDAFRGCTGLTSVIIPDSVTVILANAFGGCTGLTSVTIPNSVTTIGEDAFIDCTRLTSVTVTLDGISSDVLFSTTSGCLGNTWNLPGQTIGIIKTIFVDTEKVINLPGVFFYEGKKIIILSDTNNASINGVYVECDLVYTGNGHSFSATEVCITFDSNGGNPTPEIQFVDIGGNISDTVRVTKEGYDFAGWYDNDVRWSFDTPVSSNTHLVAHWIAHWNNGFYDDDVKKTNDDNITFMLSISVLVVALASVAIIIQRR